ncbi:MAG: LCP family protein [Dethiobacteria bacterium]|jgi:anionic cell wall polymer biosynthesis LytR-Cps2A-Psr (LCP) family protein|nr:LCP family protein [Bacillota bacterium]
MRKRRPYSFKKQRRYRLRKKRVLFMVFLMLFILCFMFSARLLQSFQQLRNTEVWAQSLRDNTDECSGINFLLFGIDYWGATPIAERMVLIHESDSGFINAIFIPGDTVISKGDGAQVELLGRTYSTGGAELLVNKVQELLDMPVHHYFSLDYYGLSSITDSIGEVPTEKLPVLASRELLPRNKESIDGAELYSYFITWGTGEQPLQQLERQRRTLLYLLTALLERTKFWQIPRTISSLAAYIETDLSWRELTTIYRLYKSFSYDDVYLVMIPGEVGEGNKYIPDHDGIKEMSTLIKEGLYVPPSTVAVEVLNGCGVPGIAKTVAEKLRAEGFRIVNIDDAEHFNYHYTQVISRVSQMEPAKVVALQIPNADLLSEPLEDSRAQVTVIVGSNYPGTANPEDEENSD